METPLLTNEEIAALVDEGIALAATMTTAKERQDLIEKRLKEHALSVPSQHERLVDEEREGTRFRALGTAERSALITFTSDLLVQTLTENSDTYIRIREMEGRPLAHFFKPTRKWETKFEDGKKFRQEARLILPDPERFITACIRRNKDGIPVSQVKVEWP